MNTIGIDVDSKYLVCQIRRQGQATANRQFPNTPAGHRQFVRWATRDQQNARVCMEATGVYSLAFARHLSDCEQIEVMVVNPKTIKHFATARLARGKTDWMDAAVILEFLERMEFKRWQPPPAATLQIQHICRRIVQLQREYTREENRHHAAVRLGDIGRIVANDTAVNQRHLQRRIARLEQTVAKLIDDIAPLQHRLQQLTSITGIAAKTGPRILAELATLPDDLRGPQWVAYAGLDPRPHESGTSINKPRRITKQGNSYLRNALYFPALVAARHDPHVKAFYDHLIAKDKKPIQVILAIMRKLLLAIWGMFKNNENWEGSKFYRIT